MWLSSLWRFVKYVPLVVMLCLIIAVALNCCSKAKPDTTPVICLPANDVLRAEIKEHQITLTSATKEETLYLPESGSAVIELHKDRTWNYHVTTHGLTRRFGGGIIYADRLRASLDMQGYYWNRLGFHVGVGFANSPVVSPFVAVSYRLDRLKLNNTSVMVGVSVSKDVVYGLRLEF